MNYIKEYQSRKNNKMFYEEPIIIVLNNEDDWFEFAQNEVYPFTIIKNSYYKSIDNDINEKRKDIKYIIEICD